MLQVKSLSVLRRRNSKPIPEVKDVDETVFWQMEFPGGIVSSSTTSYAADVERLYIAAENGWLLLEPGFAYGPFSGKHIMVISNLPQVNTKALQMDDFVSCILENRESRVSSEED